MFTDRSIISLLGPQYDHTTGNSKGWYMYIEASYPRKPGDYAVLSNRLPSATAGGCLSIFYNMYGKNIGSLIVKVSTPAWNDQELWKTNKQNGENQWSLVSINIPSETTKVKKIASILM